MRAQARRARVCAPPPLVCFWCGQRPHLLFFLYIYRICYVVRYVIRYAARDVFFLCCACLGPSDVADDVCSADDSIYYRLSSM